MKGPTLNTILRAKPKDFFGSEVLTKAAALVANITVLQACFRGLKHNEARVHVLERAKQTLAARELKPDAKVALFLSEHINTLTAQNDSGAVGRSESNLPPRRPFFLRQSQLPQGGVARTVLSPLPALPVPALPAVQALPAVLASEGHCRQRVVKPHASRTR